MRLSWHYNPPLPILRGPRHHLSRVGVGLGPGQVFSIFSSCDILTT